MSTSNHKILCASCHVALEGPADPQPNDVFSCPTCGANDTFENVIREAGEYHADKLVRGMFNSFGGSSGSGFIKMTVTQPQQRSFRFITGDESH
ncbi:hypothetical protein [Rhodoblastus sp.]|uniref:hypothetical protein n=1 Tax=Rhodoblastus sp. TaxID=1962975 RepID=UPI0035AE30AD